MWFPFALVALLILGIPGAILFLLNLLGHGVEGGEGSVTLCVTGHKAEEIFDIVQKVKEKKGEL